ncbi:TlpA disulfide reductase family protein [Algoriphagus sp. NG3]|uniref:TlpA disulfide reductase family protein n=1 Tax=Algoriphagus sp. NG3 TaxID=3097546 RepID=UPI002A81B9DB|nr:TlpA disulfide reductase family protein [Algoriphagus sp. NG3]WPR77206.1 TlpA disulfide reductase family protein [Algoriphagus sp. NG3]
MKNILATLILALGIYACQPSREQTETDSDHFTIEGDIKGLDVSQVYFMHRDSAGDHKDTLLVDQGKFSVSGTVDEPQFVMIYSDEAMFQKVFYVENRAMKLTGTFDSLLQVDVSGSTIQDDFEILEERIQVHRDSVMKYWNLAQQAVEDGDSVKSVKYQIIADSMYKSEATIRKQFVAEFPNSFASLNELMNYSNEENLEESLVLYAGLSEAVTATKKGKEVATHLDNLDLVKEGKMALPFSQTDVDGSVVSLEDYEGKYVLLEFWASWCGPCRAENPNLRAEYLKYHDKGFNIVGISLDESKEKWLKAVEKDDLPWTQVSDLKGWQNEVAVLYGVRGVPANFLISPEGKIVDKGLRGEVLNAKLKEIFD